MQGSGAAAPSSAAIQVGVEVVGLKEGRKDKEERKERKEGKEGRRDGRKET
jgi:hypothetical protein